MGMRGAGGARYDIKPISSTVCGQAVGRRRCGAGALGALWELAALHACLPLPLPLPWGDGHSGCTPHGHTALVPLTAGKLTEALRGEGIDCTEEQCPPQTTHSSSLTRRSLSLSSLPGEGPLLPPR
eukprot:2890636-Rhodomonas_salina.13